VIGLKRPIVGMAKDAWLEEQERGWADKDTFVCANCVEDEFLKSVIEDNASETTCSYCDRSEEDAIAAPFADLMEPVAETAFYYFNEPTSAGAPYEDGESIVESTYTADMLMTLPLNCNDDLFQDIVDAFANNTWIPAAEGYWAASHQHEVLGYSWDAFVRNVKHETRFHFHLTSDDDDEPQMVPVRHVLPTLCNLITTTPLLAAIATGTQLFRVRVRANPDAWAADAENLGAPPPHKARAGRMNPAGIAYLYTSLEQETALAETISAPPVEVVIARFMTTRTLSVVDLCSLPSLPSHFDSSQRHQRENLLFIRSFVAEISKPVDKSGADHVDYVPSQVVCEYLAQVFRTEDGGNVDGILYPSAIKPGGKNLVLFPTERRSWERKFDTVAFAGPEIRQLDHWLDVTGAIVPPA
jgi:RES domain-containing protein